MPNAMRCYGYQGVILDDHLRTLGRPGRGVIRPGRYAPGARPNCRLKSRAQGRSAMASNAAAMCLAAMCTGSI